MIKDEIDYDMCKIRNVRDESEHKKYDIDWKGVKMDEKILINMVVNPENIHLDLFAKSSEHKLGIF